MSEALFPLGMSEESLRTQFGFSDEQIQAIRQHHAKEIEAIERSPEKLEALPKVLPAGWVVIDRACDGFALRRRVDGLRVIISVNPQADGRWWLHLSASYADHAPSWKLLVELKELFMPKLTAVQVIPPRSRYVNIHPHTHHLWACVDGEVLPDFTGGTGSI